MRTLSINFFPLICGQLISSPLFLLTVGVLGVVYCQVARKSSCPKMVYSFVAQNFIMLNNIVTSLVHIYQGFFAPTRVKLQTMMKSIICIWFLYCKHTHLKINLHILFIASQSGDKPFAVCHSRGTKPPFWDPTVALV